MRTLLVARHGESELSAKRLVNGDPCVACPLTHAGREQARELGRVLAREQIDLCVVTEFERVRETAELALEGRGVPTLVVPELNEPRYGEYEGGPLDRYLEWAWRSGPLDVPPGGEHRGELAARYARGYRSLLDRPEGAILLVAHSITIRYLLDAAEGRSPSSRSDQVDQARLFRLDRVQAARAVAVLEEWAGAPTFEAH